MRRKLNVLAVVVALAAGLTGLSGQVRRAPRSRPASQPARRWRASRLPAGVKAHRDIAYATIGETKLALDLYLPAKAGAPRPLIVWVHGGGWRGGDKRNCRSLGMTAHGYATASINYRLSGKAKFPAQIHDCKAAIRFLRANAARYNLDPKRVGVWGSSAGGHLVALLGTSGGVKALEGDLGHADQSSRVQAVCDYFGPTDLVRLGSAAIPGYREHPVELLLGGSVAERKALAELANPITHVDNDDPPFLIVHGDGDRIVPLEQSRLLHDALGKGGVSSTLSIIKGAGHGFRGQNFDKKVRAFFDKHLRISQRNAETRMPIAETRNKPE